MATVEQLITDNLDIWSSALKAKSAAGRGVSKKLDLYGIKKLRELILELAVRGLLVPQDASDEPASALLKSISNEKIKLIKNKKIKKAKISLDSDMPDVLVSKIQGWSFPILNDLIVDSSNDIVDGPFGSKLKATEYVDEGVPIIRIQNIGRNYFKNSGIKFLTSKKASELNRHNFEAGDIVLNKLGEPTGKACIIPDELNYGIIVADIIRVRVDPELHNKQYLIYCLNSPIVAYQFAGLAKGVTRQRVNLSQVRSLRLPLPPLIEQYRIVAKVDELMALCDQLEQQTETSISAHQTLVQTMLEALTNTSDCDGFNQTWARITEHFDTLFTTEWSIDKLKQTILQLAIMGKLVPQTPNDEPASELLKKIALEKAKLIKEGKIKKQKTLPPIVEDEKPFELPKNWEWANLHSLITVMDAGWSPACHPTASPDNNTWGVLKTTAVQSMEYREFENKVLPTNKEPRPQYEVRVGDILITRAGPKNRVGVSCLVQSTRPKLMLSDKIIRFHLVEMGMCERYISLCLNAGATAEYLEKAKSGMAESQMNISQDKLKAAPIPLCPIFEQQLIVDKVDELMAHCDTLKNRINIAQITQLHLADAMTEKSLNYGI